MAQSNQQSEKNLDLALEIISRKLDFQSKALASLDAKIGILFGFVGVISSGSIFLMNGQLELIGRNYLTLGLVGLGVTLFLLVLASRTRTFLDPPDFPAFYSEHTLNKDSIEFKNKIIADMIESYKRNATKHSEKARFYDFALWIFVGSLIFIFSGII